MEPLLKVLTADEKQIEVLTAQYKGFKKNMDHESTADALTRTHLNEQILSMKKSNAVIVDHYLGEHKLAASQIEEILKAHSDL